MSEVSDMVKARLQAAGIFEEVRKPFKMPYHLVSDYYRGMSAARSALEYANHSTDPDEQAEAIGASAQIELHARRTFTAALWRLNGGWVLDVHWEAVQAVLDCEIEEAELCQQPA